MELIKCRWCGAPYAYSENLEAHERGCPKRLATQPVSRYVLPVGLQRKFMDAVNSYPNVEWIAALKLTDNEIGWGKFQLGTAREVPKLDMGVVPNAVGTVHYHPSGFKLSGPDVLSLMDDSYHDIDDSLNPLFVLVHPNHYAYFYMLPKPPEVRREWEAESHLVGKAERMFRRMTAKRRRLDFADAITLNTFPRIRKRVERKKLGEETLVFYTI